jgi:hypothetical protein
VAVLAAHRERQNAEREARLAARPGWVDCGKVFTQEDGSPLHPEMVSDAFRRICARTDLRPPRPLVHPLTHLSRIRLEGAGCAERQGLVGGPKTQVRTFLRPKRRVGRVGLEPTADGL